MPDTTTSDTKLEKAYLTIKPVTADGADAGSPTTLTLQFNPTDYRIAKSASWTRTPARSAGHAGPLQWRGTEPGKLTMTAFLDASDSPTGSVLADAEALLACCAPTPESLQRNEPCAPYVTFGWGTTTAFTAVMQSVDVTYTLFRNDGQPYRATVNLSMEEVNVAPARQNPTSGAPPVTRTHPLSARDTNTRKTLSKISPTPRRPRNAH
jgi:hypothetical protein